MGDTANQDLLDRAQQWLETVLSLAGMPTSVTAEFVEPLGHADGPEGDPDLDHDFVIWLAIAPEGLTPAQIDHLLGEKGAVLDALQYLASLLLNLHQPKEHQFPYTIDLNGYRAQRQAELSQLAAATVAQVRETGQEAEIQHLSSAERRQVHTLLKGHEDLETFSRGKEPDRRLVVKFKA